MHLLTLFRKFQFWLLPHLKLMRYSKALRNIFTFLRMSYASIAGDFRECDKLKGSDCEPTAPVLTEHSGYFHHPNPRPRNKSLLLLSAQASGRSLGADAVINLDIAPLITVLMDLPNLVSKLQRNIQVIKSILKGRFLQLV